MDIKWAETPNYRPGRNGNKIIAIVNHITAGGFPGCLNWLRNTASGASAHYLVNRSGEIYQLVKDSDTAWHAGVVNRPTWKLYNGTNPNLCTIGIEHEGFDGALTEAQYQATLWLQSQLIAKHGIPADEDHIIGHYQINSADRPSCPGPNFPWQRLFDDLKGEEDMIRYDSINDVPDWGKATVEKLIAKGALAGDSAGKLDLSHDMLRIFVINDRLGLYGE